MSYEAISWTGESGSDYVFHACSREERVPARPGLYIYCTEDEQGS